MDDKGFNFWKLLEVIALRIRFIFLFVFLATVISIIVSLLLPRWYEARALLLPPKEEGFNFGLQGRLDEDIISLTSGLRQPVMATPTDIYARILKSRALADMVVEANDLTDYYDMPKGDDLYDQIAKLSNFNVTPEGLLEISYQDKDPVMAARLANSFANQLDIMVRQLSSSRARVARDFIENRLTEVTLDLEAAQNELKEFQLKNKAVDLDQQTQLAIQSAVDLKVDLARNEIEKNVAEKTLSPSHPTVINLERKISEIKRQINEIEFGGADSSYLSLPIAEVPSLKIKYADLMSRLQLAETLYQILSEQYEQAKIQEKMNTPAVSVIDPAQPPELGIKPQRRIIVMSTFILSLLFAIGISLIAYYIDGLKERSPEDYRRASFFFNTIFGWIPGVGKKNKT